jgi:Ca2+:H+ antiporter
MLRQEKILLFPILMAVFGFSLEHEILAMGTVVSLAAAAAPIAAIVAASLRVAHHAEVLAVKVGDPYGTMILTLSAVAVEVLILAIMMNNRPTQPSSVTDFHARTH